MSDRAVRLLGVEEKNTYDFKKTIQSSSAPSIITTKEADRLIDYIIDESRLWQMARVERMTLATQWVRFLDLQRGLLRRDVCGSYEDSGNISATGKQLQARKHKAVIPICDDILHDNLTGAQLEDQILRMVAAQISNELEIIALMANLAGTWSSPEVDNTVLHQYDGWYQQLKNGHPIMAEAPHCCLDYCHFGMLMRQLPTKFRRDKRALRFFMAEDVWLDWADLLSKRGTQLGDAVITGQVPPAWMVTPIESLPLLPTNLPNLCGAYEDGRTASFMFLSKPENLVLGIQYNIEYERERDAKNSQTFHVFRISFDSLIENEDATSLLESLVTRDECCVPTSVS